MVRKWCKKEEEILIEKIRCCWKEWIRSVTSVLNSNIKYMRSLKSISKVFIEIWKRSGYWVEERVQENRTWRYIRSKSWYTVCRVNKILHTHSENQERKGHLVDALAIRGEERRGTLRKVAGRWEQSVIRKYLNGGTHRAIGINYWIHR